VAYQSEKSCENGFRFQTEKKKKRRKRKWWTEKEKKRRFRHEDHKEDEKTDLLFEERKISICSSCDKHRQSPPS
jgi:hypothetical protein